jgi:acyl carrier protein
MKERMTRLAIKEEVFKALQEVAPDAPLDEVAPNDSLRDIPDIGASGFLNLMTRLRSDLHVDIPESDFDKVGTLTELVRYLSDRLR